jgi:hypothetical protein
MLAPDVTIRLVRRGRRPRASRSRPISRPVAPNEQLTLPTKDPSSHVVDLPLEPPALHVRPAASHICKATPRRPRASLRRQDEPSLARTVLFSSAAAPADSLPPRPRRCFFLSDRRADDRSERRRLTRPTTTLGVAAVRSVERSPAGAVAHTAPAGTRTRRNNTRRRETRGPTSLDTPRTILPCAAPGGTRSRRTATSPGRPEPSLHPCSCAGGSSAFPDVRPARFLRPAPAELRPPTSAPSPRAWAPSFGARARTSLVEAEAEAEAALPRPAPCCSMAAARRSRGPSRRWGHSRYPSRPGRETPTRKWTSRRRATGDGAERQRS